MPCVDNGPSYSYAGDWKKAERELCRCRWILREVEWHRECGTELPAELSEMLQCEMDQQLEHRLEDRDDQVKHAKDYLRWVEDDIKDVVKKDGLPGPKLLTRKAYLEHRIAELKALTDDQLLETTWEHKEILHVTKKGVPDGWVDPKAIRVRKHNTERDLAGVK